MLKYYNNNFAKALSHLFPNINFDVTKYEAGTNFRMLDAIINRIMQGLITGEKSDGERTISLILRIRKDLTH